MYTDINKRNALEIKEKLYFKRCGFDKMDAQSRKQHEARVQQIYGKSTKQMSNSVNKRTAKWVRVMAPKLIQQNQQPQPLHASLIPFRSKFNPNDSAIHHPKHFVSVANDSLIPRKHLRGGGLLDRNKSGLLQHSTVILTEQQPLRLVQPQYRQPVRISRVIFGTSTLLMSSASHVLVVVWQVLFLRGRTARFKQLTCALDFSQEYPLRERDPTRDIGPSGGSIGGMVYSSFTDQERQRTLKANLCPTLADDGQSPWNEKGNHQTKTTEPAVKVGSVQIRGIKKATHNFLIF